MKTIKLLFTTFLISIVAMNAQSQNKTLVVYYSWSGNTKVIAEYIQELTNADIFRIEPINKYSTDYQTVVDQAKKEINKNEHPALKTSVENFEQYDTIYVGTPNWWSTMAPPVATFLTSYNFKGKTIVPFCTHGGGDSAYIFTDIANLCPDAKMKKGYSCYGSNVETAKKEVEKWLKELEE